VYLGRWISACRVFSVAWARRSGLARISQWLLEPYGVRKVTHKAANMRVAQKTRSNFAACVCQDDEGESRPIAMSDPEIRNWPDQTVNVPEPPRERAKQPLAVGERPNIDKMFLDCYGLNEQPFGVTPDLRFLYLGSKHRQALDVLNYGTELNRGFLTLIAEAGMGKTSLLFHYLEGLRNTARTMFVFQSDANSTELMRYMLADLGIDGKGMDMPEMRAVLSQVLMGEMRAGRRVVLVIDEAQNLDEKTLESVRLLSNFETPWMKLLHIVLSGQPQLGERLAKPSMKQLRQRVSFAVHLEPFTREEVDLYVDHRLWVAGYKGPQLFSEGARALLAERSQGIPRNINNLCFCAMSYAWATKRKTIDRDTMSEVLADLDPEQPIEQKREELPSPPMQKAEPKPAFSPLTQPVHHLTQPVHHSTERSLSKGGWVNFALLCVLGILLGWIGIQPEVGKWMSSTAHAMSSAVHNHLDPSSTPGPSVAPAGDSENAPANSQTETRATTR
jgi:type II secretory pathway predicted ATPase ExeA